LGPEKFLIALTTLPVDHDADAFARTLVDEKLAACVNILSPMRSIYAWKGAIERSEERQLLIKTTHARLRDLEARIKSLHPYEVPEFVIIQIVDGSRDYLSWLAENTSNA
jgi:periplasmic divalent cation tolerance protein